MAAADTNDIRAETKNSLNCYHSIKNLSSSHLLS